MCSARMVLNTGHQNIMENTFMETEPAQKYNGWNKNTRRESAVSCRRHRVRCGRMELQKHTMQKHTMQKYGRSMKSGHAEIDAAKA